MSQSFWESDVAEEAQPEMEQKSDVPVALSVSVDDFAALEERIFRAVNLLKQERQARAHAEAGAAQAEARAAQAEVALHDQAPLMERLQAEIKSLKAERDHVRERVDRLLKQLDTLEL
jgi:chromosome segregation ATPase